MIIPKPTADTSDFETLARRVDEAIAAIAGLDEPAKARATDLKDAIEAFHKLALTRMVRALKADPRGKELLFDMVDAPEIRALLTMHGILRADPLTRATRALETVKPYVQSHGGDVELVRLEGDTAVVRLSGACRGCSLSAVTLRDSVTEALKAQVPEIARVELAEPEPDLIPLDSLFAAPTATGWVEGPLASEVSPSRGFRLALDGPAGERSVVIFRIGETLSAFHNQCAHQGLPIDGGLIDPTGGTVTCPWHGFCFDAKTGECLTAPEAQLEPLPLQVRDGRVFVRVDGR